MLGSLLASAIARAAAEKIGETLVETAVVAGTAVIAGTAAAVVGSVISDDSSNNYQPAVSPQQRVQSIAATSQQPQVIRPRPQPQPQPVQQRPYVNEQTSRINDLYTKFAICCYIARADGYLSPEEKQDLDALFLDIYAQYKNKQVKQELLKIYNTPRFNFVVLERYLQNSSPATIASFLEVAEEMAMSDNNITDTEKNCLYKIRKYLTDRTGKDYMKYALRTTRIVDLKCTGCAATMIVRSYDNSLECPYCGNLRYLSSCS